MALTFAFRNVLVLVVGACALFVAVGATQIMRRPDGYNSPPHNVTAAVNPEIKVIHRREGSKVQMGYFTNWNIYDPSDFLPTDIDSSILTHILYAFASVSGDTGVISSTDLYADEQKIFPTDDPNEAGTNLCGCLKQLYLMKLKQRNLKVLLSVGGGTVSSNGGFNFVTDATKRATFVQNALSYIEDYGFDGIDLDYEYPSSTALGEGFAQLLTSLRTAFDNLQSQKGDSTPYLLTAAVASIQEGYEYFDVPTMDAALNYWNLMGYDYSGPWINWTDNQANLYGGSRSGISTDKAIKLYTSRGATESKIVMGIPLYGRAFEQTTGLGASYNGVGPGTISAGVYSDEYLPLAGATVFENYTDVSSYSYNAATEEFVSFDTPNIATVKAQYVETNNLAGSMFWELSQDRRNASSLVGATASVYGTLDQTLNHIDYPTSKWDNIKNNMGQS